ncbi:MAG: hypothetical protein ACFFG0_05550 [Candidatus Thorarchaeota archaeon]
MITYKINFNRRLYEFFSLEELINKFSIEQIISFKRPVRMLINNIVVGIIKPNDLALAINNL